VQNVSSRSVVLQWDEPPQQFWNGDITQYTVSILVSQGTRVFSEYFKADIYCTTFA
jgi:hypothetical protein